MTDAMTDDLIRAVAGALRDTANRIPRALSKGHPWYADYAEVLIAALREQDIVLTTREGLAVGLHGEFWDESIQHAENADDACGDLEAVSVARIIAALREGE